MFALLCIALFAGALAQNDMANIEYGDINFEWQEVTPGRQRHVQIIDWMKRGFSFNINTNNNTVENVRVLAFVGEAPEYEYLGFMAWSSQNAMLFDADMGSSSCGVVQYSSDFPSGNLTGDWHVMFDYDNGNISVWYDNGRERVMALNEFVGNCAGWMMDAKYMIMSAFSDGTTNENDYYKYAMYTQSADMCMRGEFFWQEKCNKCPPGKSTVKEGNTEYEDCIDMRYIQCGPKDDKLECEMNMCPCNDNYEECDWDMNSKSYGMCKQKSDYMNSARGVAVTTALVAMVAAFFAL